MSSGPFESERDERMGWAPIPPPEDRPGTPQDDPKTSGDEDHADLIWE